MGQHPAGLGIGEAGHYQAHRHQPQPGGLMLYKVGNVPVQRRQQHVLLPAGKRQHMAGMGPARQIVQGQAQLFPAQFDRHQVKGMGHRGQGNGAPAPVDA
ncbi:hypothetical protein MBH78_16575 [Oceanimonas sp. NS1]|nr:hypothetical protein [Oceanimonas sp. NS1]